MSVSLKAAVSKPVQEPKKHHYLPEFYLSAWCGADGRLERYVNRNGSIKTRRFATGQVGYREDLYRLLSANIPDRTALERHHFEQLDNAAAPVIARLNRDRSPIPNEADKQALARFILSLPARNPWGIATGRKIARETYGLELGDADFSKEIGAPPNRTVWQMLEAGNPHFVADTTLVQMIEVSTNEKMIERLVGMNWAVWDVAGAPIDLIVGDHAFAGHGDLNQNRPENVAAIPLGPKRFVTCTARVYGGGGLKRVDLVRIMNREGASRAAEHFYATDRKHLALAKARLRPIGTWKPSTM
jgi:Protein of unknown function (DUF4238)